jgi:hypothetical protein
MSADGKKNESGCHTPPFPIIEFVAQALGKLLEPPLVAGVVSITQKVLEVP